MNEYENNGMNGTPAPENNNNNQNNGANVDYYAAPHRTDNRPNGEYHYGYRGSYNPNYSTQNRSSYNGYNHGYGNYERYSYNAPNHTEEAPKPKKEKKTFGIGTVCALLAACIIFSAAAGFGGVFLGRTAFSNDNPGTPSTDNTMPSNSASVIVVNPSNTTVSTGNYADVATAVHETVVEISTEIVQTSSLFGQYVTGGAGSGVIISAD
ncbi:MAG: hypothetical protein IIX69_00730, partial [Clostridia bacterium]|nr:hypothetical protein [Clostridia bacterium]